MYRTLEPCRSAPDKDSKCYKVRYHILGLFTKALTVAPWHIYDSAADERDPFCYFLAESVEQSLAKLFCFRCACQAIYWSFCWPMRVFSRPVI